MNETSHATALIGRECVLDLARPCIMAILNVTPDSFSDGGDYLEVGAAVERGLEMAEQGAGILDIGGESTRPGAPAVSAGVELERVVPVIEGLRRYSSIPLSIDTSKASVAREALAAGANFVNDISGLSFDNKMAAVIAAAGAGLFLMHTRGCPQQMQKNTDYQDLLTEVVDFLRAAMDKALAAGIGPDHLAVDPGIGFAKNAAGNLVLLNRLSLLHQLGCPILLGTSRKSFIGKILHQDDPRQRLYGTLATIALGVAQGVQLFRVHDVVPAREVALVAWAIREQQFPML